MDRIFGESLHLPGDTASHLLLCEEVEGVLATLTSRERRVLELRYGLEDGRRRTQREVGPYFALGGSRIQQIEAKALRKLRHPSRSRKLKEHLGGGDATDIGESEETI